MEKITFENLKQLDFKVNEAYKRVRTNITFSGENIQAIAITSSAPNEGKTEVSFNIARSFAEDKKKVLYIDADIRKSVVLARYGVDRETKGLSHYLSGQAKLEDTLYDTNVENLNILFTGTKAPNPAELLGSEKFAKMINKLKEDYDYIIIDCPPLGSVIDAVLVAKVCDGSIIVIESDYMSYKVVQNVKKQLETGGCKILGAILNKVQSGGKGYYGYYKGYYGYYDSYGYGYGEDGDKS
ncbi:capsular exopolysaccharide family [Lachnospiraceae bacterium NE2001]|nr:capsular exopolysaccharide family [Lachnospiraceae bacterium NE2001]